MCVFRKAKRWNCNFLWTDTRGFPVEGVVNKGTQREACRVDLRALVPPVLGQSSRSVLSSAVVLWGYGSESKLTCVFEITIK